MSLPPSNRPSRNVSRYLPRPMLSLSILIVWLAITNAASLGLFLLGLTLALLIPPCTRAFWPEAARPFRWRPALRFLFVFAYDIVVANINVARRVIASPQRLSPAFVDVPLGLRDPFVATLLACVVTLTPGTLSIDVDQQHWVLRVHALDAPDPEALVQEIQTRYEAALREIFAC